MRRAIATIISGVLVFAALVTPAIKVRAVELPSATMYWDVEHQTIDGFGASQSCDVYADQIYNFGAREEIMDLLFSKEKGIGLSILRSEVGNGLNMPTIHPDIETWDFTPYEPEQWVMQGARNRGVETFMSTVWSPPAWMKTSERITRGGHLKKEYYQEYAQYLVNYIKGYQEHHGIRIDAISIANEPEYAAAWQSCLWSKEEFADFLGNYLKPTFEREAIDTDVIVGEEATWTESRLASVYGNADALAVVDIVGGHFYHGSPGIFPQARENQKRVWETEVSDTIGSATGFKNGVGWAKYVHDFMTKSEANAFLYWLGASYKKNNESLIRLHEDGTYIAAKRLYSIGNFSKFVRPGYKRIEITEHPYGNLYLSAYKNSDTGEFAIVAVNDGQNNETFTLNFSGVDCGEMRCYATNDKYNLEEIPSVSSKDGVYQLSVSGYTTTTYTGVQGTPEPQGNEWKLVDYLDDWSKIDSKSEGWMLEANNPYNAFDQDMARARRIGKSREEIVYKVENLSDFKAVIYYHEALEGLSFEISENKEAWTPIEYLQTSPVLTGGYWERIEVTPANTLLENTQYLKVIFDGGSKAWDKHLSEIYMK